MRHRVGRWPLLVGLLAALVYLGVPTRKYYWDGVSFAINIERGAADPSGLFHPNHLLYNTLGYALYRLARYFTADARALFVLQRANAVLAAACVAMICRILIARGVAVSRAVWLALLFACAATWWRFATDADAYIASILLLLGCARLLLPGEAPRPLAVSATHCGAILFHQLAVLFFPVAALALYRQAPERPKALRAVLVYAVGTTLPVLAAYAAVFRVIGESRSGTFLSWVTYHSPDSAFSFEPLRNLGWSALGTLRLFAGGKLGAMRGDWIGISALVLLGGAVFLLITRHREFISALREAACGVIRWREFPELTLWIAVYAMFLFFWMPRNTFYRLFYLPPAILLLGGAAPWRGASRASVLPCFVAALALWNFSFSIYPQSFAENNRPLEFAFEQGPQWPPGTAVAFREFPSDLWTISYFNPQAFWIRLTSVHQIEALRQSSMQSGRSLWLDGSAYDWLEASAEGKRWLALHVSGGRSAPSQFRFYRTVP